MEVGKTIHWELWLITLPFEAILSHPLKGTEVTPWVREDSTVEDAQDPIGERGARIGGTAGAPRLKPELVHLAQEVTTLWLPPRPATWLRADTQGPTAALWGDPPLGRGPGRSQRPECLGKIIQGWLSTPGSTVLSSLTRAGVWLSEESL